MLIHGERHIEEKYRKKADKLINNNAQCECDFEIYYKNTRCA